MFFMVSVANLVKNMFTRNFCATFFGINLQCAFVEEVGKDVALYFGAQGCVGTYI